MKDGRSLERGYFNETYTSLDKLQPLAGFRMEVKTSDTPVIPAVVAGVVRRRVWNSETSQELVEVRLASGQPYDTEFLAPEYKVRIFDLPTLSVTGNRRNDLSSSFRLQKSGLQEY